MKSQDVTKSASVKESPSRLGSDNRELRFRPVSLTATLLFLVLVLILVSTGFSVQNRPAAKDHINNLAKQHIDHIDTLARNHIKDHIEQHI
jgi:hypothetical protein